MRKLIIVIVALALVLIILGVVFLWMWWQEKEGQKIEINISSPQDIMLGVPFDAKVGIQNNSRSILRDFVLTIELPDGLSFYGEPKENFFLSETFGDISSNSLVEKEFKLIAFGKGNLVKEIKLSAEYYYGSLKNRNKKDIMKQISVGGSAVLLDVIMSEKALSGEDLGINVGYKNTSSIDLENLKLTINFPPTFISKTSSLKPDINNNIWQLGGLLKGSRGEIKLNGNLSGPDNAIYDFKFLVEIAYNGQYYPIADLLQGVVIAPSPIGVEIGLNDSPEYISRPNDTLNYSIEITNNSGIAIRSVNIKAQLTGKMYDFNTLDTSEGYFDAKQGTIEWGPVNRNDLTLIDAGDSRIFNFSIKTKAKYPISRLNDKNFTLLLKANIESPTIPYYMKAQKIAAQKQLETKIAGSTVVETKAYFRDAGSGVKNSGSLPPQIGKVTQYTVHWLVYNYANDVDGIEISSYLEPGVKFLKIVKNTIEASPTHNAETNQITWSIGQVRANKGVVDKPIEVVFQIEAVPSSLHKNNYMPLMKEVILKGTDLFTNLAISSTAGGIDTSLPFDKTLKQGQGLVK